MKTVELKDLCKYLPYGLKVKTMLPSAEYEVMTLCMSDGLSNLSIQTMTDFPNSYKPILRPLSQFSIEIIHGRKIFTPMLELANLAAEYFGLEKLLWDMESEHHASTKTGENFYFSGIEFGLVDDEGDSIEVNQLDLFEKLYEWHFWLGDQSLFEEGIVVKNNGTIFKT